MNTNNYRPTQVSQPGCMMNQGGAGQSASILMNTSDQNQMMSHQGQNPMMSDNDGVNAYKQIIDKL